MDEREISHLTDAELLRILTGAGVVTDGLTSLRELPHVLATLEAPAAYRLRASLEFARRYQETPIKQGQPFLGAPAVYEHFRGRLGEAVIEHFFAMLLDQKHRLLSVIEVSRGCLTASIVHPRDVFRPVIEQSAAAVIFVHNHPSGDPTPGPEDLELTKRLRGVGDLLGVRVLDHVVIGKGRYVSMHEDGYWSGKRRL